MSSLCRSSVTTPTYCTFLRRSTVLLTLISVMNLSCLYGDGTGGEGIYCNDLEAVVTNVPPYWARGKIEGSNSVRSISDRYDSGMAKLSGVNLGAMTRCWY